MHRYLSFASLIIAMEYVRLGKTDDTIPVIGMGTWKLGADKEGTIEAIRYGIGLGMSFVDTAEMYANEEIVGKAIQNEDVFIGTKVSPSHFRENEVLRACDASLGRLGVKAVDLYQLHWPNSRVTIKETMRAMEKLVDQGKIRHIGVSNFNLKELRAAQDAMKKHEIVSNQIEYSVLVRDFGDALSDYCKKNGITIIAYSPFGSGAFFDERYGNVHVILDDISKKHGKTAGQVALNWLISKGNISAIPKAGRLDHVEENAGATGWKLSPDEIKTIDSLGQSKTPIAGRLNAFTKRTAPFWSGIMTRIEHKRIKSGEEEKDENIMKRQ
jgi:diketogulonate reductase-like aldo/keto reductase